MSFCSHSYVTLGGNESDCFLETTAGKTYLPAFSHVRWQHIVIDLDSLLILEQDRIINLGKAYQF